MANTRKQNSRKNRKEQTGGAKMTVGSKAQVFHGTAKHTSGGLTKKDLMKTKAGRIVSRKKHTAGLKAIKQLKKMGYVAKKGTFKLFKKSMRTTRRRGGAMAESASAQEQVAMSASQV